MEKGNVSTIHSRLSAAVEGNTEIAMKIPAELNARAIKNGVFITKGMTKTRLIRRIQTQEGHTPCFRTDLRDGCKQTRETCEWADECKNALIAHWQR